MHGLMEERCGGVPLDWTHPRAHGHGREKDRAGGEGNWESGLRRSHPLEAFARGLPIHIYPYNHTLSLGAVAFTSHPRLRLELDLEKEPGVRCMFRTPLVLFVLLLELVVTHGFFCLPTTPPPRHFPTPLCRMATTPASSIPLPGASQALEFLRVVGKLKTLKRTGWVNNGVTLPESVADHMYRMAMCSFLITDPALDRYRLMKIAVVHDLAEALVGDIVPHDTRYTKEQKRALEEVPPRMMWWGYAESVTRKKKTEASSIHTCTKKYQKIHRKHCEGLPRSWAMPPLARSW